MRSALLRLFVLFISIYILSSSLFAQYNGLNTGINGLIIDLPCGVNCVNWVFRVPHLKSTSDYTIRTIPYTPYPYTTVTGNEAPGTVYADDFYSPRVNLPFNFCFYDSLFSKLIYGSNGLVTFDTANENCSNAWPITTTIPFNGGTICASGSTYYPKASIMGAYSDLDPRTPTASPSDRKIEWRIEGTAPARRLIVSYFHIGVFNNPGCGLVTPNTFQIVMYESTGIIEIFIEQKACQSSTSGGRAILGIQNWTRDRAVAAPGKNNTVWNETNTAYRFVPSGPVSRFVSCELQTLSGAVIITGDTITTTTGLLDVTFQNFCPTGLSSQYRIKTTYTACDNPGQEIIIYDTITVNKTTSLNISASATQSACGVNGTGTITVNVPIGVGTAPFTYLLTPGNISQSTNTFTNLTGGNYTVNVTDASGVCSSTVPVTVTSSGLLTPTFTSVSPCAGSYNGSITINVPNALAPVQYQINNGPVVTTGTTHTFTGLTATTLGSPYFLEIHDAGGCSYTGIYTLIGTASTVTGTAVSTNTTCALSHNGTIEVTPTSNNGPYTFSINNGASWQTSNIFTGLDPGNYTVLIQQTAGGGCTSSGIPAIIVAGNNPIQSGIFSSPTPCTGVNQGTITITPTTGVAPFTAILNGTITLSGNSPLVFTGVAAGSHSVTVADANGCTVTSPLTTTVNTGTGYTAAFAATATACAGGSSGSLVITPQAPGTAPFFAVLNPGGVTQSGSTSIIFNNLLAGTYNAVVTDANGCQYALNNMTVSSGPGLAGSASQIPTTCSGVSNGSISINMSSGTAPFAFVLDGTTTQSSTTNTVTFNNLSAGSHNITVTDANGCITTVPITATVATGTGFTASFSPTATGCAGVNNGSLVINPQSPGTAPFTVVLNPGGITQTGAAPIFNNLAAGTYSAVITDAIGCQFTLNNMTVATGAGLVASTTSVATSCSGVNNGSLSVTMNNGTAPFTFLLDGTITQTSTTNTISFTNLSAGSHNITVTDANGCITVSPLTVAIAAGTGITASHTSSPVICSGGSSGSIAVTASAGVSPFTFVLNGTVTQTGNTSTVFIGLPAGAANSISITDAVGCTFNLNNIIVTEPQVITASAPVQSVRCNGGNDGRITINASGGTPPYTYSLDNITFQSGNIFNVAAGIYTIYIRDANGCVLPTPVTNIIVAEPVLLTATANATNATCDGGNDGRITVIPAGGTSTYQFSLDGTTFQASNVFNTVPGTYNVTVRDINGCNYTIQNVAVGLTNNLTLTPAVDPPPICEGSSVQLQANTNATQFSWTPGNQLSGTTISNPIASPATTTLYTVTATLGRCSITDDVLVRVIPAPVPDAGPDGNICFGQSYQLQGSGGVIYTWTPSAFLSDSKISSPVLTPDRTLTYTLNVTDANGCPSLVTDQVTVNVTPPIRVNTYPFDTVVFAGAQIPLLATSSGTSYTWSPSTGLDNPAIANPVATVPLLDGSIITYRVTVTTSAGCQGQGYVKIQVYKGPDIYVATAFTPNSDGKNDLFIPFPVGIKKLNYFRVFNRWGQMLFSTTILNKGWDGMLGGTEQASGVYVWMIEGVTMDDKVISKKGTVTLIR